MSKVIYSSNFNKDQTMAKTKIKKVSKPFKAWDFQEDGVSPSSLTLADRCKEQFRLSHKEGWNRKYSTDYLAFGDVCHYVIDMANKKDHIALRTRADKKLKGSRTTLTHTECPSNREITLWVKEYEQSHLEQVFPSPEARQENEKVMGLACIVMEQYFKKYYFSDIKKYRSTASEESFRVPYSFPDPSSLGEVQTTLNGTWDELVIKLGAKPKPFIFDTKCSSSLNEGLLMDTFTETLQFNLYMIAYRIRFGIYPKGIIVNYIKRPTQKITKKDGNLYNYLSRVKSVIEAEPEKFFFRLEAEFTQKEQREWEESTLKPMLLNLQLWTLGKIPHYCSPSALTYMNSRCELFDLITRGDTHNLKKGGVHWEKYRSVPVLGKIKLKKVGKELANA